MNNVSLFFSVIIPVYNRPNEVQELLESLEKQSNKNFEVIIIEDGSEEDCKAIVAAFSDRLKIVYKYKPNSGPGDSRNVGMTLANGDYFIFFDSDCIIPSDYFSKLEMFLLNNPLDTFGGPDGASPNFTNIQKAINYSMTSVLTTGGIRGKKNKLDQYQPRSFNMGIHRKVYETVGGFGDIHPGEDPDLSYRIMNAGFQVGLIENAVVYHKRRIDFRKFVKQVYKFGVVRVILMKWYPDKTKMTYFFPSLFLLASITSIILYFISFEWVVFTIPIIGFVFFIDAFIKTKSLSIAVLSIFSSFIQLYGYGYGFLKSFLLISIARKEERHVFPTFFYRKS